MSVHLPKSEYDDDTKPAWLPIQDREGHALKPLIRCACGQLCGIGLHHVHPDGTVTASFLHQWPEGSPEALACQGCGWHEYLILDNWTGDDFPPESR